MKVKNAYGKGTIMYGMHFYPGVAEYQEPGKEPYRVFLNEDTIRSMDPSFAGRPIFVEHVEEVDQDIDELKKEADGWVIESFFNSADGKHWAKFIIVSEMAEIAIRNGMRLSNAYVPTSESVGGLWNGVAYAKEIKSGEYDHLAIVRNPRYEESVIMTPEEFKKYNEDKLVELKRLSNSKDHKGEKKMAFKLFKKTKVENSIDVEGMSVVLPKSGKEMTISDLVTEHDKILNMQGYASGDHMVKIGENEMSVNDLVKKHMELNDELEAMKTKKNEDEEIEEGSKEVGDRGGDKSLNEEDEAMENEEDEDKKKENEDEEKEMKADKKKNEIESARKKSDAKAKADRLRNASHQNAQDDVQIVEFSADQVARGKARYGSN